LFSPSDRFSPLSLCIIGYGVCDHLPYGTFLSAWVRGEERLNPSLRVCFDATILHLYVETQT